MNVSSNLPKRPPPGRLKREFPSAFDHVVYEEAGRLRLVTRQPSPMRVGFAGHSWCPAGQPGASLL